MRGDRWSSSYARKHPCPDSCELCGRVKTAEKNYTESVPPLSRSRACSACSAGLLGHRGRCDTLGEYFRVVVLCWDHCHDHNIVRGALCRDCNVGEGTDRSTGLSGNGFTEWRTRCPECVAGAPSRDPVALRVWLRREAHHTGRAQREYAAWEARLAAAPTRSDRQRAAVWAEACAKKVYEERLEVESWADRWAAACKRHRTDWHTPEVRRKLAARWETERPAWEAKWASGQSQRDAQWEAGRSEREALWAEQWEADAPARKAERAQRRKRAARWEAERPAWEAKWAAGQAQRDAQWEIGRAEEEEQRKQRARARRVELRTIRAKLAARAAREEQKKLRDERRALRVSQGCDRNGAAR